jgi:cell division septum initiation protein DivIVA
MNKLLEEIERLRKENEQLRQRVAELESQVYGGSTK